MIETPPKFDSKSLMLDLMDIENHKLMFAHRSALQEINEEYHYWTKVKYIAKARNLDPERLWRCVKFDRHLRRVELWEKYGVKYAPSNEMQRLCHFFDMNFGGHIEASNIIPDNRERYLISSLMEEAISSSQMEGAATTRKIAKNMLRKEISPRSRSEQMIYNNYQTIQFIVAHKHQDLTPEMLLEIHRLMTEKTLERAEDAGRLRNDGDDVWVENQITHEIVHTPPQSCDLPDFIEKLCAFFNGWGQTQFIHPIIRAITIHFMIAYMHPFVDGNGRTARALFYWYMLRNGYWLLEYMPISRIIGQSKKMYEKSFLYSESDGNDIGYFIIYNLHVLEQAFNGLKKYIQRKIQEKHRAKDFLLLGNINERQAEILRLYAEDETLVLTVKDVRIKFHISPTTAKSDLIKLVKSGYLDELSYNKVKKGYLRSSNFQSLIDN